MQAKILDSNVQAFISKNLHKDTNDLVLKGIPFEKELHSSIIDQIKSRSKAKIKLPEWYKTEGLYYPPSLNLEQTSSEITAKYKASLISGKSLIDLTGGLGVDSYYFNEVITKVTHCEINEDLITIANHNSKILNSNITFLSGDGISILKNLDQQFDWIYMDPSRRSKAQQKVFLLSDCSPNAKTFKGLFLKYANNVMIKTSPLLDIKKTMDDLEFVSQVHIVAVNNEVKELLWILERNASKSPMISCVNITKNGKDYFNFNFIEINKAMPTTSLPLTYLYEPNVAILKSGAFNLVAEKLEVFKLHQHSHLYTSETLIDFPGRCFTVNKVMPFHKKTFAKEGIKKANITTRNFPMSVHDIRKKLSIKDGGDMYLFFTTLEDGQKTIISCSRT